MHTPKQQNPYHIFNQHIHIKNTLKTNNIPLQQPHHSREWCWVWITGVTVPPQALAVSVEEDMVDVKVVGVLSLPQLRVVLKVHACRSLMEAALWVLLELTVEVHNGRAVLGELLLDWKAWILLHRWVQERHVIAMVLCCSIRHGPWVGCQCQAGWQAAVGVLTHSVLPWGGGLGVVVVHPMTIHLMLETETTAMPVPFNSAIRWSHDTPFSFL